METKSIGQRLYKHTKENGITIAGLARQMGMQRGPLRNKLTGKGEVEIDLFLKICKAINVDYHFFLEPCKVGDSPAQPTAEPGEVRLVMQEDNTAIAQLNLPLERVPDLLKFAKEKLGKK